MNGSLTKIVECVVLVAILGVPAQAATVAYWQFNEHSPGEQVTGAADEILDSSGGGHHGTIAVVPVPSYVETPNDAPSALSFGQAGALISVPDSSDFDVDLAAGEDLTLEAILRLDEGEDGGLFVTRYTADADGRGYTFNIGRNAPGCPDVYLQGAYDFVHPGGGSGQIGSERVDDGNWHHVAIVVESDAVTPANNWLSVYVDHQLTDAYTLSDITYYGTDLAELLANPGPQEIALSHGVSYFGGELDCLRVSEVALGTGEFLPVPSPSAPGDPNGDLSAGTSPTQAGTVAFWQFNEHSPGEQVTGATDEILDSSGHAHHGTAAIDPPPIPGYVAASNDPPSALSFDGADTLINVPDSSDFDVDLAAGDDVTLEAILRLDEGEDGGLLVTRYTADLDGRGYTFNIGRNAPGCPDVYLQGAYDFVHPGGGSGQIGTVRVDDGEWHHVAIVVDSDAATPANNQLRVYVDHDLTDTYLLSDITYYGTDLAELLANPGPQELALSHGVSYFGGELDCLRVSNAALIPSEFLPFGSTIMLGDLDGDGFVGGADLDIVRSFWGQDVTPGNRLHGDPSGDGFVGGDDLDEVRAHWGEGTPPGSTPVPEPSTGMLLGLGVVALALGRWIRCRAA